LRIISTMSATPIQAAYGFDGDEEWRAPETGG
jgi:hypothetical protein